MKLSSHLRQLYSRASALILHKYKDSFVDPNEIYFGQQHAGTMDYFKNNHTIPMSDFPQVKFLQGRENDYKDYLKHSFAVTRPHLDTDTQVNLQVRKFRKLIDRLDKAPIREPVLYTTRFDGKKVILDGNHRAAFAYHKKIRLPAVEVPLKQHLWRKVISNSQDIFGSKKKGMPYQSVYYQNEEIFEGRRNDIAHRFSLIYKKDIVNKSVLDMGCNIGSTSFLAALNGAKSVTGIDLSPRIITSAIRLNILLYGTNCLFKTVDLSQEQDIGSFDTGFAFSIDAHIKNNPVLISNLTKNIKKVVYFECHRRQSMTADLIRPFKRVDFIGYTDHLTRKFYRCEL